MVFPVLIHLTDFYSLKDAFWYLKCLNSAVWIPVCRVTPKGRRCYINSSSFYSELNSLARLICPFRKFKTNSFSDTHVHPSSKIKLLKLNFHSYGDVIIAGEKHTFARCVQLLRRGKPEVIQDKRSFPFCRLC